MRIAHVSRWVFVPISLSAKSTRLINTIAKFSVALLLVPLASCGGNEPDCGSQQTQDLVIQIAKDNGDNQIMAAAIAKSKKLAAPIDSDPLIEEKWSARQNAQKQATEISQELSRGKSGIYFYVEVCVGKSHFGGLPVSAEVCQKWKELEDQVKNLDQEIRALTSKLSTERAENIRAAPRTAIYSLSDIRLNNKEPSTKAVICRANLTIQLPDSRASNEVAYRVERTTEGRLYATVFGLK